MSKQMVSSDLSMLSAYNITVTGLECLVPQELCVSQKRFCVRSINAHHCSCYLQ